MGSGTGLPAVVPTKVKAHKSIIFTEGTPEVEINAKMTPNINKFILSFFAQY